MSKKQTRMLRRILLSGVLFLLLMFLPLQG